MKWSKLKHNIEEKFAETVKGRVNYFQLLTENLIVETAEPG